MAIPGVGRRNSKLQMAENAGFAQGGMGGMFGMIGQIVGDNKNTSVSTTQSSRKVLSQEAFDKIIYDVLSSDSGLASLASGENASGGFGSSTKTLQSQDLTAKLVGELASVTAETVQTGKTGTENDTPLNRFFGEPQSLGRLTDKTSVICTWLKDQGFLDLNLYNSGHEHFSKLPEATVIGYRSWAVPLTGKLHKSPKLVTFFSYVVHRRYQHISGSWNLVGAATVYLGQPACYLIGKVILGANHGRFNLRTR